MRPTGPVFMVLGHKIGNQHSLLAGQHSEGLTLPRFNTENGDSVNGTSDIFATGYALQTGNSVRIRGWLRLREPWEWQILGIVKPNCTTLWAKCLRKDFDFFHCILGTSFPSIYCALYGITRWRM